MDNRKIFHLVSYLRFPFFLWAIYFIIKFFQVVQNGNNGWAEMNNILVLFGIGFAFSSLKDPQRRNNFLSKRIWKNKTIGILVILFISILIAGLILLGLSTLFFSKTYRSETIAVGMIVLGIGLIGYLKYAVERMDNN